MPWIYGYLIAWVAGGVLLTTWLLLAQTTASSPISSRQRALSWACLACLGFGGGGLALEALGHLNGALRPFGAAAGALLLLALGAALRRRRA